MGAPADTPGDVLGAAGQSGLLFYCNDDSIGTEAECVGTFVNELGILVPRCVARTTERRGC